MTMGGAANREVFVLNRGENWYYVYAPLQRTVAVVNGAAVKAVSRFLKNGEKGLLRRGIGCSANASGAGGTAPKRRLCFPPTTQCSNRRRENLPGRSRRFRERKMRALGKLRHGPALEVGEFRSRILSPGKRPVLSPSGKYPIPYPRFRGSDRVRSSRTSKINPIATFAGPFEATRKCALIPRRFPCARRPYCL